MGQILTIIKVKGEKQVIGVYITINGEPIFARTAVNRLRETGKYVCDDGTFIEHDPKDGAVRLAIKMLETIKNVDDVVSARAVDNK